MKIFVSIIFNALILFALEYFMPANEVAWTWVFITWWYKLYFIWWVILWMLNSIVKPLLKVVGLPFMIMSFWFFILVINWIILFLLETIIRSLNIYWVSFSIKGAWDFVIAVAILTLFNTIYSAFLKK